MHISGNGPTVVFLHGFPHTWRVWSEVIDDFAVDHRTRAPDLRGFGGSTRTAEGMDAATVSRDIEQLIATLGPSHVTVVGRLPGADAFFATGPPWRFGFHAVPGLAEQVLRGHEAEYVERPGHPRTRRQAGPSSVQRGCLRRTSSLGCRTGLLPSLT